MGYELGVDLGTTYTAAAVHRAGRVETATLGERAASIPSVVFLREDDQILTGEAAARRVLTDPGRVAREFKRRFGDPTPILLGGSPYSAERLMAGLLRAVVDAVREREGDDPGRIAVTHPANWGPYKTDLLVQAVRLADLPGADLLTEPEAAAIAYASSERVEPGEVVAVYDLGGGTFDAAVLRKTEEGFEILGVPEGIERLGGIDFDESVFAHVRAALGAAIEDLDPSDATAMAAVARLRLECVDAKEALSSDTDAAVAVMLPGVQTTVRLTRAEFESMVRPVLGETIGALRRTLTSAAVEPAGVRAVLLVGGSSRIPLVAELVTAELGRPVAIDVHPKHAVALGAALAAARLARAAGSGGAGAGGDVSGLDGAGGDGSGVDGAGGESPGGPASAVTRAVTVTTVAAPEPGAESQPEPQPEVVGEFWFYVEEAASLVSADDPSTSVGTLVPGTWYQAVAEQDGWVWAVDDRGAEGWIPANVVRRYEG